MFVAENTMSLRGVRGLICSMAFFSCISVLFLRYHLALPTSDPEVLYRVMGKPLEKVNVDYTRNIHFSVKTSVKNYRTRLSLLLLTWFQAVEKDQVWNVFNPCARVLIGMIVYVLPSEIPY